jgi:uncharacterized RDD family membrane protein YckC
MASTDYSVLTPERVNLEYGIAGIGSRGAAVIVDTVIQVIALVLVAIAITFGIGAFGLARTGPAAAVLGLSLFALATFVVVDGYFIILEIVWNGQTPGKRLVGLRVIRESGYPIQPVDAVIRNLVRILDWLPFFYAIGVLVMLLNKRSKRLGDYASGTIVVRESTRARLSTLPLHTIDSSGYSLSSADATLVRDFLVRRPSMHPAARSDLALRLARLLANRYHLPLEGEAGAEQLLEQLSP